MRRIGKDTDEIRLSMGLYLGDEFLRVLLLLYMFEMYHSKKFKRYLLFNLSVWGKKRRKIGVKIWYAEINFSLLI